MAVRLESTIKRYIGLSTDIKPAHQTDTIPPGSSFLEEDTGLVYRSTGTAWAMHDPGDEQMLVLREILRELVNVRLVLEFRGEVRAEELVPA